MILVYPMLVDDNISMNAIPGITKMLERYILLYRMDSVFRKLRYLKYLDPEIYIKARRKMKEEFEFYVDMGEDYINEQSKTSTFVNQAGKVITKAAGSAASAVSSGTKKIEDVSASVGKPSFKINLQMDALGLEPTFIQIGGAEGKYAMIGIKVVPCRVKSDANLIQLIDTDRDIKFMMSYLHSWHRGIMRLVFTFARKIPFLKDYIGALTGDPKKDVLWGMSDYKTDVFVLFNSMSLKEESNLQGDIQGIRQLFRLGWNQIIIADDVSKNATFCMKEFKGLCSTVPYSFMYSTLGKDKVYDNLEDVRRSSGAFGKLKRPGKIFGEEKVVDKMTMYLEEAAETRVLIEGMDFLSEDVKSFFKRLIPSKAEKDLDELKDDKKADKVLDKVPDVPLSKIEKVASKLAPDFPKAYKLSQRVIKNSVPNLPEELANHFAAAIAFKGSYKQDDAMASTKNELKAATPILMRAAPHILVGAGLGVLWAKIAIGITGGPGALLVIGLLLIIARAIRKIVKTETKLTKDKLKTDERAAKRQADIDLAKAKGPRVPLVYVQK